MKSKDNLYPFLERYLKGAVVADWMYRARRPENWLKVIGLAICVPLTFSDRIGLAFCIFAFLLAGMYLLCALRIKSLSSWNVIRAMNMDNRMAARFRSMLGEGRLADILGADAMSSLDSCAKSAMVAQEVYIDRRVVHGDRKERVVPFRKSVEAADRLMREALDAMTASVLFRRPPEPGEIDALTAIEVQLADLATDLREVQGMLNQPTLAGNADEAVAHLGALRAAHKEINADLD